MSYSIKETETVMSDAEHLLCDAKAHLNSVEHLPGDVGDTPVYRSEQQNSILSRINL
jgi:hypothetical protein